MHAHAECAPTSVICEPLHFTSDEPHIHRAAVHSGGEHASGGTAPCLKRGPTVIPVLAVHFHHDTLPLQSTTAPARGTAHCVQSCSERISRRDAGCSVQTRCAYAATDTRSSWSDDLQNGLLGV